MITIFPRIRRSRSTDSPRGDSEPWSSGRDSNIYRLNDALGRGPGLRKEAAFVFYAGAANRVTTGVRDGAGEME